MRITRPTRRLMAASLIASCVGTAPTWAADIYWDGDTDDAWGTPTNWDTDTVPGASDTANFDLGNGSTNRYAVNGITTSNDQFIVHTDALELVLDIGETWLLTNAGNDLSSSIIVGDSNGDVADLLLTGGGTLSGVRGIIGHTSGSTGTMTVGADTTWSLSSELDVGDRGNGTLTIEEGGTVTSATVHIASFNAGTNGAAKVTGLGSTWNSTGQFVVGYVGEGTLDIEEGGSVSSWHTFIGRDKNQVGKATVTGQDSAWDVGGILFVGYNGLGELNIEAGGELTNSAAGFIGRLSNGSGVATVTGAGSTWNNLSSLNVGDEGAGTLNILDSGLVTVSNTTHVRADGTLNIAGGGALETATLDHTHGGILAVELDAAGNTAPISISTELLLDTSELTLTLASGLAPSDGDSFNIFDFGAGATVDGEFSTLNLPTLAAGLSWDTNDLLVNGSVSVVPEPSSLALLGIGGLCLLRRRR